jgi:hypothetical protein
MSKHEDLELRRVEAELREIERQEYELAAEKEKRNLLFGGGPRMEVQTKSHSLPLPNVNSPATRKIQLDELKKVWQVSLSLEDELLKLYAEVEYL